MGSTKRVKASPEKGDPSGWGLKQHIKVGVGKKLTKIQIHISYLNFEPRKFVKDKARED